MLVDQVLSYSNPDLGEDIHKLLRVERQFRKLIH